MKNLLLPSGMLILMAVGCGSRLETQYAGRATKDAMWVMEKKEAPKADPAPAGKDHAPAPAHVQRKIKYTADMQLICDDFDGARAKLLSWIPEHKGYIAQSEVTGGEGTPRRGFWRVRIPVANFDDFRDQVRTLGQVERDSTDSEDVTDEYYDLERNIQNLTAHEDNLRDLLKKADKVENLAVLMGHLHDVRDEINRKQGRLKLLQNLTDLTTVRVTLRERIKYEPQKKPEAAEVPTLGQRISRTFSDSWQSLRDFGEELLLVLVALVPWLPLLVPGVLGMWIGTRRLWRRMIPASKATVAPPPTP